MQAAVKEVEAKFGKIDFLINNAGIMAGEPKMSFALDEPLEAIEEAFKVNVLGPLAVTRAFYPLLLKGTGKTIVNVSTAAASLNWHIAGVAEPNVDPMRASSVGYKMSKVALNLQVCAPACTACPRSSRCLPYAGHSLRHLSRSPSAQSNCFPFMHMLNLSLPCRALCWPTL